MIKIMAAPEFTNSFPLEEWKLTQDPFTAFRGAGPAHRAFLPVGREFDVEFPVKVITAGAKKTLLLVNTSSHEAENIVLVTVSSGFRGSLGSWKLTEGVELLAEFDSNKHCMGVSHAVLRFDDSEGSAHIAARGRRCDKVIRVTANDLVVFEGSEFAALEAIEATENVRSDSGPALT